MDGHRRHEHVTTESVETDRTGTGSGASGGSGPEGSGPGDDGAERGPWRLAWPTFRGSSTAWGVLTAVWLLNAVSCVWSLVTDEVRVLGVAVTVFFVVAFVVCLVGTIATVRHPRPGPPWR